MTDRRTKSAASLAENLESVDIAAGELFTFDWTAEVIDRPWSIEVLHGDASAFDVQELAVRKTGDEWHSLLAVEPVPLVALRGHVRQAMRGIDEVRLVVRNRTTTTQYLDVDIDS